MGIISNYVGCNQMDDLAVVWETVQCHPAGAQRALQMGSEREGSVHRSKESETSKRANDLNLNEVLMY